MARYSLATSLLTLLVSNESILKVQGHNFDSDAWSYLPVTLPTPLSDTSIVSLTVGGNSTSTVGVKTRIIITGGCDNPLGNEERYEAYFECPSLTNKAYAFDPIRHSTFQAWTGEFETLADMPRARARHASAVVDGNVCVYGGRNLTDHLIAEVDCYDPSTDEWSTPTSLPAERQSSDLTAFATATDDRHLVYLIGGYDQGYTAFDMVTIVDMTDMDSITFSDGPQLITKRGDIDVAIVDDEVYVSGGFTHENDWAAPLNSVEKLNVATQQWSDVDSLNEERGDKQLVALNGKLYALGGEDKLDVSGVPEAELPELGGYSEVLDTVEVLDLNGNVVEWKSLASMPGQLFRFSAAEWEVDTGFIFVFGGQLAYDSDCKCFRTTDKVMVFDVHHAEDEMDGESLTLGNGAGVGMVLGGNGIACVISVAVAGLVWLTL